MRNWPAQRFLQVAVSSLVLALLMVPAIHAIGEANLPLWLHIPLAVLILTLFSVGALAAGICYMEYRARSLGNGRQQS
jgi:ABC-type polysaccharide/polyol phosphate export permease